MHAWNSDPEPSKPKLGAEASLITYNTAVITRNIGRALVAIENNRQRTKVVAMLNSWPVPAGERLAQGEVITDS